MNFHFLWRLLYNSSARLYDFVSYCVSRGRWRPWGRTTLSYLKHKRILELAHGPGHLLIALKTAGFEPIGIDLSPRMGKRAMRRLRRAGLEVPLVRCRAEALPFRTGSFDEAVATFPTDYILSPDTIREVARVTSEQGRFVALMGAQRKGHQPNPHFVEWLRRVLGKEGTREERKKSAFVQAGMRTRIEHQSVGDGAVILIVAEKRHRRDSSGTTGHEPGRQKTTIS